MARTAGLIFAAAIFQLAGSECTDVDGDGVCNAAGDEAAMLQYAAGGDLRRVRKRHAEVLNPFPTDLTATAPSLSDLVDMAPDKVDSLLSCLVPHCMQKGSSQEEIGLCTKCVAFWFNFTPQEPGTSARNLGEPADKNHYNSDIPADHFKAKAGNSGPLAYLHMCNGKVADCKPTRDMNCYGPGSTCLHTWKDVVDWSSQIPEGQWNGTLWRGHELGTGFLTPYLWSGRGISPLAALGVNPNQHYVVRPYLEKIFGAPPKNSEAYRATEDMVRASVTEFLETRKKQGLNVDMMGDLMPWVHQLLYQKAFGRKISDFDGKLFMAFQLAFLMNGLQSVDPPTLGHVPGFFAAFRDQGDRILKSYIPMVEEMYGEELAKEDCSPSVSCVVQLASSIMDGFLLAGGVSLTHSLNAGMALLFSTATPTGTPFDGAQEVVDPPKQWNKWGNPFPKMAYEKGEELRFYWEVLRYFAPVGSIATWRTPVTCAGLSAEETKALLSPDGKSKPCPPGPVDEVTKTSTVNQYTGGKDHIYPVFPAAQRDPTVWGPDANLFKIRPLDEYKKSVGFGEFARNDKVAGGRMNRNCPGKSFSLMVGSIFFEVFDKADWVISAEAARNITFTQGAKPPHAGFKLSSKQMVAECREICPSKETSPEAYAGCESRNRACNCNQCVENTLSQISWSCGKCRASIVEDKHDGPGYEETFEQEYSRCPSPLGALLGWGSDRALELYQSSSVPTALLKLFKLKDVRTPELKPDVVDRFAVFFYFLTRMGIAQDPTGNASEIKVPTRSGPVDMIKFGDVEVPAVDWDGYKNKSKGLWGAYASEQAAVYGAPPDHAVDTLQLCLFGHVLTSFTSLDQLDSDDVNQWKNALWVWQSKKDWIMALWSHYTNADGEPAWPASEFNLQRLFRRGDHWDDQLEQALVFNIIGTQRVEMCSKEFGGETLPFVVRLNAFNALAVRPGFDRYGVDMYFTSNGMPAMLVTPDGKEIGRGETGWNHWKWVFRSTLVSVVTLLDHLHFTHYRTANILAGAVRRNLKPDHPARRFLTVFTYGTIAINYMSIWTLSIPGSPLARTAPLRDFYAQNYLIPKELPDITEQVSHFTNDTKWSGLHQTLQNAPFYSDGKIYFAALSKMIKGYFDLFKDQWCDQNGKLVDPDLLEMTADLRGVLEAHDIQGKEFYEGQASTHCDDLEARLGAALYTVTAYHRHVGQVGDLGNDPELVAFGWKEGETSARPIQALITSTVAAATGIQQPKINMDYSHVFAGMDREAEARNLWARFRADLNEVSETIKVRNAQRKVPYFRADPGHVECSVAI